MQEIRQRFSLIIPFILLLAAIPVFGQVTISDTLSGFLEADTYLVVDTVIVAYEDTLTVEAGSVFLLDSLVSFEIYGHFFAIGTEDDSIVFVSSESEEEWASLVFRNLGLSGGELGYCYINGAAKSAVNIYSGSDVWIHHSTITGNRANWGGAIYISNSNPVISDCIVSDNWSVNNGGGIYNTNSNTLIENCIVYENLSDNGGSGSGQGGGGICANHSSNVTISNCEVYNNDTFGHGGGIVCNDQSQAFIEKCRVYDNHSNNLGGGIFIAFASPVIENCTVFGNAADTSGGGIAIYATATPEIRNCIVSGNLAGGGVEIFHAPDVIMEYCAFFGNADGEILSDSLPPGMGEITTVNANGDSSDVYYNFFLDPQMTDPENADFTLIETSPCIDAGDPDSPLDPDATIADVGAFYFHQWEVSPVLDLVITVNGTNVSLSWPAHPLAQIYNVYRASETTFEYGMFIGSTTNTIFNDSGILNLGTEYFYQVRWE